MSDFMSWLTTTKHLGGQHDQKSHAYRYGKNLTLSRARGIRKGGNWDDYKKRARGGKPTKGGAKPQKSDGKAAVSKAFGRDPNKMYEFRTRVVDLDDLIASNTSTGAVNPKYTPELQPRDRSRTASQQQIDTVAKNLVPESVLFDFHQIDRGTPIIGDDMMVESGNGRTLALKRAKEQYPERWNEYQSKLKEQMAQHGISESELAGIKNPVLVRERLSKVNRADFAKEANQANVLQMSPLERAKNDAKSLKDSSLFNLQIGDDQSIDQALRSPKNARFVQEFLGGLPDTERASLMRGNGTLNQMGLWRMKAAVFSKVFQGEAGERLADTFLEGLDSTTKNFEKSIVRVLPKLAQAESLINSGQRPKVSIMNDVSKSLDMLARLRENGMKVKDYLAQKSFFERELTPRQEQLLARFGNIGRSTVSIRNFFNAYADAVINMQNPAQMGLFGGSLPAQDDIFAILMAQGVL